MTPRGPARSEPEIYGSLEERVILGYFVSHIILVHVLVPSTLRSIKSLGKITYGEV